MLEIIITSSLNINFDLAKNFLINLKCPVLVPGIYGNPTCMAILSWFTVHKCYIRKWFIILIVPHMYLVVLKGLKQHVINIKIFITKTCKS